MLVHRRYPPHGAERKCCRNFFSSVFQALLSWRVPRAGEDDWYHLFVLGIVPVPPSRGLSWQVSGHGGCVSVPLKETSVESLLRTSTQALAELQVPREQLSEVLEQIHSGRCGAVYRTKMYTGDPAKPKTVVLKALKGKRRSV